MLFFKAHFFCILAELLRRWAKLIVWWISGWLLCFSLRLVHAQKNKRKISRLFRIYMKVYLWLSRLFYRNYHHNHVCQSKLYSINTHILIKKFNYIFNKINFFIAGCKIRNFSNCYCVTIRYVPSSPNHLRLAFHLILSDDWTVSYLSASSHPKSFMKNWWLDNA